jgi:chromosome segregation ATPase
MATKNNTDLQELKTLISDRFNQLDRKLDETKAELKQDISNTRSELKQDISDIKGDIKALHVEVKGLDKRLSIVENSVAKIPEITEKFGELKNWRQTAFVIIAGVVSAFLGWLARGSKV